MPFGAGHHLELTSCRAHRVAPSPTVADPDGYRTVLQQHAEWAAAGPVADVGPGTSPSPFVRRLRGKVGHGLLLLLAGVAAVIRDEHGRLLLQEKASGEGWALPARGVGSSSARRRSRRYVARCGRRPASPWSRALFSACSAEGQAVDYGLRRALRDRADRRAWPTRGLRIVPSADRAELPCGAEAAASGGSMIDDEQVSFAPEQVFRGKVARRFEELKLRLASLAPGSDIQHVGSTAIPGALTKGDLDVQVRVSAAEYTRAKQRLESVFAVNHGGFVGADATSYEDYSDDPPVGVHLTTIGGSGDIQWKFRDRLIASAALRREYDELKRRFEGGSMTAYRDAKAEFVGRVLAAEDDAP
jgi:GrpB-like predicted nucleotidyltransferase (UPF0157 family)